MVDVVPLKLQAAMFIMEKDRMSILECQAVAKHLEVPDMGFDLCGPKGRKACRWVDPSYGIFEMETGTGVERETITVQVATFMFMADIWCEGLGK